MSALHCGREENASSLVCVEAKFFYLQKLPSGMTPFCILDVNLFLTVFPRANPKDKKINVKNSGLPRTRESSLNASICILQIHRKQIKLCQYWLPNEAGWGYTAEKDSIVGKVSNCPTFCFCKRILLTPTWRQKLLSPPQMLFFPILKQRISRAEAPLHLRASNASLNKSLHCEIPSY